MQIKNKWEKLFDEFLDLTEFRLIKHKGNDVEYDPWIWSIVDLQGANLGNIEGDRFSDAQGILDRMDIYINDYCIQDIEDLLEEKGIDITWDYDYQDYIDNSRVLLPQAFWEFEVLDMICNHYSEIDLNNCYYEEGE